MSFFFFFFNKVPVCDVHPVILSAVEQSQIEADFEVNVHNVLLSAYNKKSGVCLWNKERTREKVLPVVLMWSNLKACAEGC